jgi:endonuclease YncB( thermonuclease family)
MSTNIPRNDRTSPNAPGAIDCKVTDGDTLNCKGRRIRLIGIDAPELPGHCRPGRDCVKGDPFASSGALQRLIQSADLQIVVLGRDKYDRELANVYANGRNVACDLIAGGYAIYKPNWDEGETVREDCSISIH